jgi:hypothetical protein
VQKKIRRANYKLPVQRIKIGVIGTITPAKFRQFFGELSPAQLQIIKDKEARTIVVASGPRQW